MTCHYPDLGSACYWLKRTFLAARRIRSFTLIWVLTIISGKFLRSLLKGHFAGRPDGVAECSKYFNSITYEQTENFMTF